MAGLSPHLVDRFRQRYGLELDAQAYADLIGQLVSRKDLRREPTPDWHGPGRERVHLIFRGTYVRVVWVPKAKAIVTFLPTRFEGADGSGGHTFKLGSSVRRV